jgi:hypothetical protein
LIAGDFFSEIPAGFDAYILAHVLHDWTYAQVLPILHNCRRAIPAHGRLLIVESVLPPGNTPHLGKLMDLLMLAVTGGAERTASEFSKLLRASGFATTRIAPLSQSQSVIEAVPL